MSKKANCPLLSKGFVPLGGKKIESERNKWCVLSQNGAPYTLATDDKGNFFCINGACGLDDGFEHDPQLATALILSYINHHLKAKQG